MLTILHFADAHIDMARSGRLDAETGLPVRVMDFLRVLDEIIDTAIREKVDLVLFCGDAYRDRTPAPTFQREWGKRMKRLSQAKIPTFLIIGNHDLSPASGRAHALQEYETLEIPFIRTVSQPQLLRPEDLFGLPLQVIGLPWLTRSKLQNLKYDESKSDDAVQHPENQIVKLLSGFYEQLDPNLPAILAAHASVQGATFGNERNVMLGKDILIPSAIVKDKRLDYVALGHIHKAQDLNPENHPPVIYPGSIEKVNFGEANDKKQFIIVQVEKGKTNIEWHKLSGRKFIDIHIQLHSQDAILEQIENQLPPLCEIKDAIVRMTLQYPHEWEAFIDEPAIRRYAREAFEFHFLRQPQLKVGAEVRQADTLLGKSPIQQLDFFFKNLGLKDDEIHNLKSLAEELMAEAEVGLTQDEDLLP